MSLTNEPVRFRLPGVSDPALKSAVLVALIVAGALVARAITVWTIDFRSPWTHALPYVGVTLAWLVAILAVARTGFYRHWMVWKPSPPQPAVFLVAGTAAAVFVLIEAFAGLTFLLETLGLVGMSEPALTLEDLSAAIERKALPPSGFGGTTTWYYSDEVYSYLELHYLWHFLDAVPVLKIPQTLNWDLTHRFVDVPSGVLLLAFKVLVILPVVRLALDLWKKVKKQGKARTSA